MIHLEHYVALDRCASIFSDIPHCTNSHQSLSEKDFYHVTFPKICQPKMISFETRRILVEELSKPPYITSPLCPVI